MKELVRAVKVQTSYLDDVSIRYDFNSFAAAIQNIYHKLIPIFLDNYHILDLENENSLGKCLER